MFVFHEPSSEPTAPWLQIKLLFKKHPVKCDFKTIWTPGVDTYDAEDTFFKQVLKIKLFCGGHLGFEPILFFRIKV